MHRGPGGRGGDSWSANRIHPPATKQYRQEYRQAPHREATRRRTSLHGDRRVHEVGAAIASEVAAGLQAHHAHVVQAGYLQLRRRFTNENLHGFGETRYRNGKGWSGQRVPHHEEAVPRRDRCLQPDNVSHELHRGRWQIPLPHLKVRCHRRKRVRPDHSTVGRDKRALAVVPELNDIGRPPCVLRARLQEDVPDRHGERRPLGWHHHRPIGLNHVAAVELRRLRDGLPEVEHTLETHGCTLDIAAAPRIRHSRKYK